MHEDAMNTLPIDTVTRFRTAFVAKDPDALTDLLGPDAEIYSPVHPKPYRGRRAARAVFRALTGTFDDVRYLGEMAGATWDSGDTDAHVVVFRARVNGVAAHGVTLLQLDDADRITAMTTMIRPLAALTTFERLRDQIENEL
ncbi:nuclear transport factor 2 family protein [Nocardia terpenica]|uniref:Nuclear transport factor 2 family protein n=1 Tax=Nocardia terpenica TaxID=455432 RepID=A0A6G9Z6J4_9NOCA|nr:nuclear transport factor 2 family protein [Nocardia terpenica]QIS21148.1 nuclear transport factor 2 family protein [Nocardia terpenica]